MQNSIMGKATIQYLPDPRGINLRPNKAWNIRYTPKNFNPFTNLMDFTLDNNTQVAII